MAHTRLDVFQVSKAFVLACYRETKSFPSEEKFGLISQIRRAVLSVHLNISEGCTRKSVNERNRFYEIARGSVIEIETAFEIAVELGYVNKESLEDLGVLLVRTFQLLSKLIKK